MKKAALFTALLLLVGTACQRQQDAELMVSATQINLPQEGGYVDFNIFTNTTWQIKSSAPESFYYYEPTSGKGSATVRLHASPNPFIDTPITEIFNVITPHNSVEITVCQAGIAPIFTLQPLEQEVSHQAGTLTLSLTSNLPWEAAGDASWCQINPEKAKGDALITLSYSANTAPSPRTAQITFTALQEAQSPKTLQFLLKQEAFIYNERMQDSLALVKFYEATGGTTWAKNQWDLTTSMDTWPGLRLNAEGRVDSLNIASGVITQKGPIPEVIGQLTALTALSLSSNNFTGEIPETLSQLTQLKRLSISSNAGITGEFPTFICALTSLERLSLSSMTGLKGALPAAIGQLVNLVDLNLVGCSGLLGPIPPQIGNLTRLTNLQMSGVPFTGTIPQEFGNLVNLENIGLYSTQLSLPIPDSFFDNLKHLASILLHRNPNFNGPLPEGFGRMTTTAERFNIQLHECNFTGTLPEAWAGIPIVSGQLRLQGNRLEGTIPEVVKQHTCWDASIWNPAQYICPQQVGYGFTNCD